jgi:hypothetical protein
MSLWRKRQSDNGFKMRVTEIFHTQMLHFELGCCTLSFGVSNVSISVIHFDLILSCFKAFAVNPTTFSGDDFLLSPADKI